MKVIRYTKKGKKRLDVKFSKKEEIIMSVIAFTLSIFFIITGQITIEADHNIVFLWRVYRWENKTGGILNER